MFFLFSQGKLIKIVHIIYRSIPTTCEVDTASLRWPIHLERGCLTLRYNTADTAEPVQLLHRPGDQPTPARRGPFWDTQPFLPRVKGVSQYIHAVTSHSWHFRHIYKCTAPYAFITGTETAGSQWLSRYVPCCVCVQEKYRTLHTH